MKIICVPLNLDMQRMKRVCGGGGVVVVVVVVVFVVVFVVFVVVVVVVVILVAVVVLVVLVVVVVVLVHGGCSANLKNIRFHQTFGARLRRTGQQWRLIMREPLLCPAFAFSVAVFYYLVCSKCLRNIDINNLGGGFVS